MIEKQSMIIKTLNIIPWTLNKYMKMIILNEYMQNIHLGFNEVWKYLGKCVMENHYSCIILKYVMW